METGDGRTEDSGGLTPNEENVIRLPRDWLGPPEELVPIGPAARARAAQRDAEQGMPPAADAFWSEDSAALHDAVQAPRVASHEHLEPSVGLVPPVAGRDRLSRPRRFSRLLRFPRPVRFPRRVTLPGLGRLLGAFGRLNPAGRPGGVSRWRVLIAVPAVAALAVIAVIGSTEGPASHPAGSRAQSSHASGVAQVTSTAPATSGSAPAAALKTRATTRHHAAVRSVRSVARTRARVSKHHPTRPHHRVTSHRSAGSPATTITEPAASTPSQSSAPAVTPTTPTAATASASHSEGSKAAAPPGPTSIGSMSGGCNPKCS